MKFGGIALAQDIQGSEFDPQDPEGTGESAEKPKDSNRDKARSLKAS